MKMSKSIDECQKNIILSEISCNFDDLKKSELINEIMLEENKENSSEMKKV